MAGESRLWSKVQPHLKARFYVQRIENLVGDGIPDTHLQLRSDGRVMAWVELKYIPTLPKRATTRVFGDAGLRPSQVAWIYGRASAGGRIYVLAGAAEHVWLVHGRYARLFNDMTYDDLCSVGSWMHSGRLSALSMEKLCQTIIV